MAPIPLVRRNPAPPPVHPEGPLGEQATEPPAAEPPPERVLHPAEPVDPPHPAHEEARNGDPSRELGERPAFDALNDPLSGPLREPLLAPLLDPTIDNDPSVPPATSTPGDVGAIDVANSDPAGSETVDEAAAPANPAGSDEPADSAPVGANTVADDPDLAREQDDWSSEWLSGSWAMAPSDLAEEPSADAAVAEDDSPEAAPPPVELDRREPRPAPRRIPRHRYADENPEQGNRAAEPASEPTWEETDRPAPEPAPVAETRPQDAPEPEPVAGAAELGLRPESLARLSDEDRQLLARLQAELSEGRRPRVVRRAGIANGSGSNGSSSNGHNGTPRSDPPDLAG
ncbi:hypothetical protein HF577_23055 [Pseudonocardia xinjiangensis]|uniref:Syndecan 1 n=1 Tax=Pseudonocardia xinjiangensis TaxID=75289 RepID=A0ABX1RJ35_9PSEU|nr:hypothetical protein [Pseudonocardia xinjiangensis]